ncbi:hypothetical protein MKW92_042154 [Papaver armeniacum]|nr:hypothetical protein MKW92_042154 [Papaver armeniacum]
MAFEKPCPKNSFSYNSTLCACFPGYLLNSTEKSCGLFNSSINEWSMSTGVKYSATFPETLLGFDSIKNLHNHKLFKKLGDGSSIWFKVRWWISRLDFCFSTRHWLRKTELGGTFSVASWIVFVGFFAAVDINKFVGSLTGCFANYIKRSVEVHNLRAANAPELLSFINDMEFNITTVSSMSCSHLRGLGTLVTGIPGFVDHRVFPLKTFANYSCHNTSLGPTVSLKCSNCRISADDLYVSWQFVDLPNDPATANSNDKHISFVNGMLNNGSSLDSRPTTFRGPDANVLKFHLFPRLYRNHHDLKLITSVQGLRDGLINTTLFINFLSAYIVEVDDENFIGPVGFFADLGGLYAISFAIFFYLLVQLRKYVMYTWNCKILEDHNNNGDDALCGCVPGEPRVEMDLENLKSYSAGTQAEHGSSEEIILRGLKYQIAAPSPLPPVLEPILELIFSDIRKNLQNLYEYNVMLRENLISAQSMIEALTKKDPVSNTASQT